VLWQEAQKHEKLRFKCRCSFLEIYNEQIADLLEPSSSNLQVLVYKCDDSGCGQELILWNVFLYLTVEVTSEPDQCVTCVTWFREIREGEEVLSAPKALPRTPPPPGSMHIGALCWSLLLDW